MNRREALLAAAGATGLALGARAAGLTCPPGPASWTDLDRRPDTGAVQSAIEAVLERVRRPQDQSNYGTRVRILTKTLGVVNEEERGLRLTLATPEGGVARGIADVLGIVRQRGLTYPETVRVLCKALGVLSEEHRVAAG
jgi:hypothetical protein